MRGLVVVCALVLACLGPAAAARAGLLLEHEAVMPNPANPSEMIRATVRSWHEGRRMKRESPLRGETIVIDLEKREVYGIHEQNRTWWKMPAERYQQLALGSLLVMGVKMGPDGQPRAPEPMFVATQREAEIEGRRAREVQVASPGAPGVTMSLWISKDVGLSPRVLEDQMRVSMGDPRGVGYDALFRQWGALDGYPVQNVTTVRTPQGTLTTSETLLTVRALQVPDSDFAIPGGFALIDDPLTALERAAPRQMSSANPTANPTADPTANPRTAPAPTAR